DAVGGGGWEGVAFDERPLVNALTSGEYGAHLRVKVFIGSAQGLDVAVRRPRFDLELRLRCAGNKIDLLSIWLYEVDDDVPIRAPPLGVVTDIKLAEMPRGKSRAIGDPPGETRFLRSTKDLPYEGMHAVSTDQRVCRTVGTVGERECHAIFDALETD